MSRLLFFFLVFSALGCRVGLPTTSGVQVLPAKNTGVQLLVKLKNPNFFGLKVKDLQMAVELNGDQVAQVSGEKSIRIRRYSEDFYPFFLNLNLEKMLGNSQALVQLLSGQQLDLRVVGEGKVRYFLFFKKSFSINQAVTR